MVTDHSVPRRKRCPRAVGAQGHPRPPVNTSLWSDVDFGQTSCRQRGRLAHCLIGTQPSVSVFDAQRVHVQLSYYYNVHVSLALPVVLKLSNLLSS